MGRRRPPHFIEEIKAKQRNTVWPEMQANSRAADSLIFLGDRNASPIQRIGFFIANAAMTPVIAVVYFYPRFSTTLLILGSPWIVTAAGSMLCLALYLRETAR